MKANHSFKQVASSRFPHRKDAFSLTELLLVIAAAGVLFTLQLAANSNINSRSHLAVCRENLRQLTRAWQVYANANNGELVYNIPGEDDRNWVYGWLDFDPNHRDNTNISYLISEEHWAKIGPYVQSAELFHCPDDSSAIVISNKFIPRVRSYSMNSYVGTYCSPWWYYGFMRLEHESEILEPDKTFVFIDERADSINDGCFYVDMDGYKTNPKEFSIIDYPAMRHFGGANLSFADGHIELWQWRDPRTMPPMQPGELIPLVVPSPDNQDVARLQNASTYVME